MRSICICLPASYGQGWRLALHAQIVPCFCNAGAGKTFTLGSLEPDNIGMMPRAAAAIFSGIKGDVSNHYTVHMSYIQIYMELIQVPVHCFPSL